MRFLTDQLQIKNYPSKVSPGEVILIKIPNKAHENERKYPWVGRVTKTTLTKIFFEWMSPDRNGFWKWGLVTPKAAGATLDDVLATLVFPFSEPMPESFLCRIKEISGIN